MDTGLLAFKLTFHRRNLPAELVWIFGSGERLSNRPSVSIFYRMGGNLTRRPRPTYRELANAACSAHPKATWSASAEKTCAVTQPAPGITGHGECRGKRSYNQLPDPLYMCTLVSSAGPPANGDNHKTFLQWQCLSEINNLIKTFNNGSLGSGIDEERSEMR